MVKMKSDWDDFLASQGTSGENAEGPSGYARVRDFGDTAVEYRALLDGPAVVDRSDRILLEVTGADRLSWLHNLTTNHVNGLSPGEGQYAFALNLQGRILFDMNVLVRKENIWIDLDRHFEDIATAHFNKYTISEDVTLVTLADRFVRLGLAGERAKDLAAELGATNAGALPWYGMTEGRWSDEPVTIFRHDFCGTFGLEMLIPVERAPDFWTWLVSSERLAPAIPAGWQAVDTCRIEAGILWSGREITDTYLPAETRLLDRAVSFQKGCYLGQEVVERMRSRSVVARQLVGLRMEGDVCPKLPLSLQGDGGSVSGTVTSLCQSVACGGVIGLGYIKSAHLTEGATFQVQWDDRVLKVTVEDLPFRSHTKNMDEKGFAK